MELDDPYWSNRYIENTAAWDAGTITTPLKEYIGQLTDKNIAILIPGWGNSHEAEYLLQQGFTNITLYCARDKLVIFIFYNNQIKYAGELI